MPELTELQKMQAAYAYFTLEEWKILASCVSHRRAYFQNTDMELNEEATKQMLSKFPSAVL